MRIAQIIVPGHWTEMYCKDLPNIPLQHSSNNCGIFVLMYALYIVLEGDFDFSETNMPSIRRWWCALLLEGSRSPSEHKSSSRGTGTYTMEPTRGLADLPTELLRQILLEVIFEEGDGAYLTLSLVCKRFHNIVGQQSFRRKAHFAWLDSIVDWKSVSPEVRKEYRVEFKLTKCDGCGHVYKDAPGYCGHGQKGVFTAFYSDREFVGFCSMECYYTVVTE